MKKLFILTAVITVLTLNTGCNRKDKIAPISVIGSWYAEYDKDGTFYDYGASDGERQLDWRVYVSQL